jgi:hypothetical protein
LLKFLPVTANYSNVSPDTFTVDHWRCRFVADAGEGNTVDKNQLISLLQRFNEAGLDVVKTENLYNERRRKRLFGVSLKDKLRMKKDEGRSFGFVLFYKTITNYLL